MREHPQQSQQQQTVRVTMPTPGRIVWFRPSPHSTLEQNENKDPLAAIVTCVHSAHLVNLTVFELGGYTVSFQKVPLVQDGEDVPPGRAYCEWMPYQKAQHAKQS